MTESKQTDKVSELAKFIGYDAEVLRAIDLPEERLNNMFDRAKAMKKITNFVQLPALVLMVACIFGAMTGDDEESNKIKVGAYFLLASVFVGSVYVAGGKNPTNELNQARDARLVELAKQQPPQP